MILNLPGNPNAVSECLPPVVLSKCILCIEQEQQPSKRPGMGPSVRVGFELGQGPGPWLKPDYVQFALVQAQIGLGLARGPNLALAQIWHWVKLWPYCLAPGPLVAGPGLWLAHH